MKPGALMLVHLVEKRSLGFTFERSRSSWPLHITLVPWFYTRDEPLVEFEVMKAVYPFIPFVVRIGQVAEFGLNHDVPVNVLATQDKIKKLHEELLEAVMDSGATLADEQHWVRDEYEAHVTHHGSIRLEQDDTLPIDDVTLVKFIAPNDCQIVKTFSLGAS